MKQRTMVKISAEENIISLISPGPYLVILRPSFLAAAGYLQQFKSDIWTPRLTCLWGKIVCDVAGHLDKCHNTPFCRWH